MNRLAVGRSARAQQAHKVDNRIDRLHKIDNRFDRLMEGFWRENRQSQSTISAIDNKAIFDAPPKKTMKGVSDFFHFQEITTR